MGGKGRVAAEKLLQYALLSPKQMLLVSFTKIIDIINDVITGRTIDYII